MGDLLLGGVVGQDPLRVAGHAPRECRREQVDRNVAGPVDEVSSGVAGKAIFIVQLGVFHHADPAVRAGHDSDLLRRVRLSNHLARSLRARAFVKA